MTSIFTDWQPQHASLWGRHPLCLRHSLHENPLFTREALVDLISRYPREHYSIIHMGAQQEPERYWKEGDAQGLSGDQVLEAVESGRFWLNLRCTDRVDARYASVLAQMFSEIESNTGQSDFPMSSLGILVSSPNAQVYFHSDLPNQSLWQVSGQKTVWIYPPSPPFLTGEDLERIAIFELEVDLKYETWYDEHAIQFELQPGQMLHWPLNAPHRVTNHDCLNVSVTTEYWADDARRSHRVNMANGTLRHRFGLQPRSRSTSGAGFFAKSLLNSVISRTGWLEKVRSQTRTIEFELDNQTGQRDEVASK
ncbi:MAG: cupin-like domain-containing protein [Planctomycetota bacterium]